MMMVSAPLSSTTRFALSSNSVTVAPGATATSVTLTVTGNGTGADGDALTSSVTASDSVDHANQNQTDSVTTTIVLIADTPVARGDAYATPVYNPNKDQPGLVVEASHDPAEQHEHGQQQDADQRASKDTVAHVYLQAAIAALPGASWDLNACPVHGYPAPLSTCSARSPISR